MDIYVGCKIVEACPEIKDTVLGYKVKYADGYISWSPKDTFEECYRLISNKELAAISDYT